MSESSSPLLAMRDIVVEFGRVRVLDQASLEVFPGEMHALLGENGAGKSSLVKVLFGLYAKSEGQIELKGSVVDIHSPEEALRRGIAMIHQELPFARHLTVAQNMFLGKEPRSRPFGFVDERAMNEACALALEPFPIEIDPRRILGELSLAQQQIVAIAKALATGAELIVLDEATTALTRQEAERLFGILRDLRAAGKTFIMITHKLDEVFETADRTTVLRDGRTVFTAAVAETDTQELVRHMVGRELTTLFPTRDVEPGPVVFEVRGLSTRHVHDISFSVRAGEVLGIGGLMGAGRTELFDALFGVDKRLSGEILVNGTQADIRSPLDAIEFGVAYVTEDRKKTGLALLLGIEQNVALVCVKDHVRFGFVDDGALAEISRRYAAKFDIKGKSATNVGLLSGGNQQKVVLAKWLATQADVFLLDEPTRGIDVGTKREVYDLINELSAAGKAVLLVTSELPELMAMSDRFLVMSQGRVVRALDRTEATPESIIYYASVKPETAAA